MGFKLTPIDVVKNISREDFYQINASIDKLRGVSLDLNTSITKLSQQTSNHYEIGRASCRERV